MAKNRFWTQKCKIDVWYQLTIEFPRDANKNFFGGFWADVFRGMFLEGKYVFRLSEVKFYPPKSVLYVTVYISNCTLASSH